MFNIAVAQSGGPTAAINASLAGVFSGAEANADVDEIFGTENGIEGIINNRLLNLRNIIMDEHDKQLLMKTPSTILGSCRFKLKDYKQDEESYLKILDTFTRHNIKAFFYIGGNDSMDTVMKLNRYFSYKGVDIKVVGVPKTIDNDVTETDHTPGFGSAAKYVATSLQEIIRDSRVYSIPSVTIVEIMGRDAGWLAASSC
ncbi:MAG: 6-phosphofructokinase, partial [Oscillospiraceae bacterium]